MGKYSQKIADSFKSSKVRYGGYATLVTVVVIVLLVALNLLVDQLPGRLDLTQNRMYSLSQQTYDVLDNLDQDVRIIGLYPSGREDKLFDLILQQYADRSPYIEVSYVDPVKDPMFSQKYVQAGEDVGTNDFIVESDRAYRIVDYYDIVNYTMNQSTYQYQADSLSLEEQITSAIQYVTSEDLPKLYMIKGHGEADFNGTVKSQVDVGNYQVEDLALVTLEAIPEDADVVVINGPQSDLTPNETDLLRDYMANDGNLVVLLDVYTKVLPNLDGLLRSYGVAMQDCLVIETDPNHMGANAPIYLFPVIQSHVITDPIIKNDYKIGIYMAKGIEVLDQRRDTLDIVPLLTTSDDAYGETDYENLSPETIQPADENDIAGPVNLAVMVTDTWYEGNESHTSRLLVGSSTQIIQTISFGAYGNLAPQPGNVDFFMNALGLMVEREESISIRPVDLKVVALPLTDSQTVVYAFIAVILIPLAVLGTGIYVFLRRRHL